MGEAIGSMLPSALAIAISPFAVVAAVLVLTTRNARVNGLMLALGWAAGVATVGGLVLLIAGDSGYDDHKEPATWVSLLFLALGLTLLMLAVKQWRRRPATGATPETPGWMAKIDGLSAPRILGLGFLLSGPNPKNLLLGAAGAAAIAQSGISAAEEATALAVFVGIASLGVVVPFVAFLVFGAKSERALSGVKDWFSRNNDTIMTVILVILGVKLIGDAISGLG